MGVKIELAMILEEFSTAESGGRDYKCRLTASANGISEEWVFNDPITALEQGRQLAFSWVQTFVKLKQNTKARDKKRKKVILQ